MSFVNDASVVVVESGQDAESGAATGHDRGHDCGGEGIIEEPVETIHPRRPTEALAALSPVDAVDTASNPAAFSATI